MFLRSVLRGPVISHIVKTNEATIRMRRLSAIALNAPLQGTDPEVFNIISREEKRQRECISLIASENFAPRAVQQALSSVLSNKYSEGYPGARYYGGNQYIDELENMCRSRALALFGLDAEHWGVNVQALSGSPANFAVYTALLQPHDRILYLALPHGGHLSHGFQTETRKVSAVAKYFETTAYHVDPTTGVVDYEEVARLAEQVQPKLIIAGTSAYSRLLDYGKFREIADRCGAILFADMAHIAGLVAAKVIPSPFEYADIVTTTTHKTLRGPRGAIIFYRKGLQPSGQASYTYEERIQSAVFPGMQGGPHNHTIAGITVALGLAMLPEFMEYQKQVIRNAAALAAALKQRGFDIVTGGTDTHLAVVDLRSRNISGAKVEKLCEAVNIILNKNTLPVDKSAMNPSGIRIGSPAMTSRGLKEKDFEQIADFLVQAVEIACQIQEESGPKLAQFQEVLQTEPPQSVQELREAVLRFTSEFPSIGTVASEDFVRP